MYLYHSYMYLYVSISFIYVSICIYICHICIYMYPYHVLLFQVRMDQGKMEMKRLYIHQRSSITRALPPDYLVVYPGESMERSYPSGQMQSAYSTSLANWAQRFTVIRKKKKELTPCCWSCQQPKNGRNRLVDEKDCKEVLYSLNIIFISLIGFFLSFLTVLVTWV